MEEEAPLQHCSIVGARGRVSIFFEGLGPWMHGRIPARWHLPRWEIQCRYSAPMYSRFPGRCMLRRVLAPLEPCATGAVVSEPWAPRGRTAQWNGKRASHDCSVPVLSPRAATERPNEKWKPCNPLLRVRSIGPPSLASCLRFP